jgi:hypothetical protein
MLQAWTLQVVRRVGLVTAGTIVVEDSAPGCLLRVEPKFRVAFTPLHIAAGKKT